MAAKLRILCLHGFTSNGQVHSHQLRRLTNQLPEYDFLFPDGPHVVEIATQMDLSKPSNQAWSDMVTSLSTSGHRAWWFARDGNFQNKEAGDFFGLDKSLDYLSTYIQERGPVHAIWGFSQGACFAGMLCALLQEKLSTHPLRRHFPAGGVAVLQPPASGVIFSGFRARFQQYDSIYEPGIDIPMLHVLGEQDPLVDSERSEALMRICKDSALLKHEGGHDIPKGEEDQRRIVQFVRKSTQSRNGASSAQASM